MRSGRPHGVAGHVLGDGEGSAARSSVSGSKEPRAGSCRAEDEVTRGRIRPWLPPRTTTRRSLVSSRWATTEASSSEPPRAGDRQQHGAPSGQHVGPGDPLPGTGGRGSFCDGPPRDGVRRSSPGRREEGLRAEDRVVGPGTLADAQGRFAQGHDRASRGGEPSSQIVGADEPDPRAVRREEWAAAAGLGEDPHLVAVEGPGRGAARSRRRRAAAVGESANPAITGPRLEAEAGGARRAGGGRRPPREGRATRDAIARSANPPGKEGWPGPAPRGDGGRTAAPSLAASAISIRTSASRAGARGVPAPSSRRRSRRAAAGVAWEGVPSQPRS